MKDNDMMYIKAEELMLKGTITNRQDFVIGWTKAREYDEESEYLKNQIAIVREAFMMFQSDAQITFDNAMANLKKENENLKLQIKKLESKNE